MSLRPVYTIAKLPFTRRIDKGDALYQFWRNLRGESGIRRLHVEPGEVSLPFPGKRNIGLVGDGSLATLEPVIGIGGHFAGQRDEAKQANFVHIPPIDGNLFIVERGEKATLYARCGTFLNRDNYWVYGKFPQPIPLHSAMHPYLTNSTRKYLQDKGICFFDDANLIEALWRKETQKELMIEWGMPTAPYELYTHDPICGYETSTEILRGFAIKHGRDIVIKKTDSFSGKGMLLTSVNPKEDLFSHIAMYHLAELLREGDVLIEKRIKSYPYFQQGKREPRRMDWYARFLVTRDKNGKFIVDFRKNAYVKYRPYDLDFFNAGFQEEDTVEHFFTERFHNDKDEIIKRIEHHVRIWLEHCEKRFPSHQGIYAFDLTVDENKDDYFFEVGIIRPGGLDLLVDSNQSENKWDIAVPFSDYLLHLAEVHDVVSLDTTSEFDYKYLSNLSNFNILFFLTRHIYSPGKQFEQAINLLTWAVQAGQKRTGGMDLQCIGRDGAYASRGTTYHKLGNLELAYNDFKEALRIDPNSLSGMTALNLRELAKELDRVQETEAFINDLPKKFLDI